jgi:hypothetical protein
MVVNEWLMAWAMSRGNLQTVPLRMLETWIDVRVYCCSIIALVLMGQKRQGQTLV